MRLVVELRIRLPPIFGHANRCACLQLLRGRSLERWDLDIIATTLCMPVPFGRQTEIMRGLAGRNRGERPREIWPPRRHGGNTERGLPRNKMRGGRIHPTIEGVGWWSQAESNRRPLECHSSALPTELWPHTASGLAMIIASAGYIYVPPVCDRRAGN